LTNGLASVKIKWVIWKASATAHFLPSGRHRAEMPVSSFLSPLPLPRIVGILFKQLLRVAFAFDYFDATKLPSGGD
jgi:hypothetical protein